MKDNGILKVAIVASLIWLFRKDLSDLLFGEREYVSDIDTDTDAIIDTVQTDTADPCQNLIYQPLSQAGVHGSDLLPKGTCYIGDSYWDDKPSKTGDKYADDQAEDFQKQAEYKDELANMSSVVVSLVNTTDEDIISEPGNVSSSEAVWGDTEPYDFSSWFLPSLDELEQMYLNLHAEGVGGFSLIPYWSSTEATSVNSYFTNFSDGDSFPGSKTNSRYVRPARTFKAAAGQYELRDTAPGGGLIFYIDGTTYYEAAPADISDSYYWSNITDQAIGTTGTAIGTGLSNTQAIIAQSAHITSAAYASTIHADEFSLLTADYSGTQIQIIFKLISGKSINVNWGDGSSSVVNGRGSDPVVVTSNYQSNGSYDITITGDIFHVSYLTASSQDVSGDISNWSALTLFDIIRLISTNVSGDISSWSALKSIRSIRVENTNVSGDISSWSDLTSLLSVYVYNTNVSGDISSWSTLTSLTTLYIYNTSVSGDISSWSTLTSLETLQAYNTSVTGDISSWSALTSLQTLQIQSTNLSGDISSWSTLTSLQILDFNNTSVSGDISSFSTLTSLIRLIGNSSNVSGDISSLNTLTSVQLLILSNTSVSGDISSFSTLTSLVNLILSNTSIDFDSSAAWTGHDHDVYISDCALTSTQVDNALIAFANGGSFTNETIFLDGTNAARTSASDAAKTTLEAAGNTVNVNE